MSKSSPAAKFPIRTLVYVGIFAALIAVCAQIAIPMPIGVNITLQTLAVMLAGAMLGPKWGFFAALVYVLLGAVGAPVFSLMQGGLGVILGPPGGFIMSFPIMAALVGFGTKRAAACQSMVRHIWFYGGMVLSIVVNFICGMLFFMLVTGNAYYAAFFAVVVPFLPGAFLDIVAVTLLVAAVKKLPYALRFDSF